MRATDTYFRISQESRERIAFRWSTKGNLLAVAGEGRKVSIYNRNGRMMTNFNLPPLEPGAKAEPGIPIQDMCWDATGTKLAILPRQSSYIVLWTVTALDSSQARVCCSPGSRLPRVRLRTLSALTLPLPAAGCSDRRPRPAVRRVGPHLVPTHGGQLEGPRGHLQRL